MRNKILLSLLLMSTSLTGVQNGFSQTINFTLANPQPGLVEVYLGTFASGDIDGDGDIDLFMTGKTPQNQTKLYTNDGTGNFADITNGAFTNVGDGQAIFKDLDNDGDLDLYFSGQPNSLSSSIFTRIYKNNGFGVFTQVPNAGLPNIRWRGAAIADVDNDGDQDIVMTGTGSGVSGVYLNNGNAVFTPQGNSPFSAVSGPVAFIDMENDGDQDVIISGGSSIKLYQNNGSGIFTLNNNSSFAAISGQDIDVADTDNDGDLDFLVNGDYQNLLYLNNGSGVFTQVTTTFQPTSEGSNAIADLDNDGDQDILIVGFSNVSPNIYNFVYQNTGNNVFVPADTFDMSFLSGCVIDNFNGDNLKDIIIQEFEDKTTVYWNSTVICTAPATPAAITGSASMCPASSNSYSVAAVPGASSYTWTLPGGWTGTSTTNSITVTAGATGGNISVAANNACGASASQALAVTVTSVDTSVSQSGITLTAAISGATYQWINCTTNSLISGQTNQSFTAAENGTYAVIITQNACSDTSSCFAITKVGIEDEGSLSSISLYPNPSSGYFQFSIDGSQIAQGGTLEIYTVEGKRIYQSLITQTTSEIDLSHQASGMYWVKFYNGQAILTRKIVLE